MTLAIKASNFDHLKSMKCSILEKIIDLQQPLLKIYRQAPAVDMKLFNIPALETLLITHKIASKTPW